MFTVGNVDRYTSTALSVAVAVDSRSLLDRHSVDCLTFSVRSHVVLSAKFSACDQNLETGLRSQMPTQKKK